MEAREKHKENLDKITEQDQMLNGIARMGYEAHSTAQGTLQKMRGQRDQIISTIDYTRQANQSVAESKNLLNMISRKEFIYKFMLYVLVIVLFLVIIGIILHQLS